MKTASESKWWISVAIAVVVAVTVVDSIIQMTLNIQV